MPTSPRPYQDSFRKDSKMQDIYKRRKSGTPERGISAKKREQFILWNTFYRRNIFQFIIDIMEVQLFPFQIILIYLMSISPTFVGICSRAASKSFTVAVYVTARSILYPGLETIIAATTKAQAGRIISNKIQYLYDNSTLCKMEISKITANNNVYEVNFRNGSKISVVAANEGALGARCNDLVVDEYAQMPKEILDNILKPFLIPRQVPFIIKNPEYENMSEPVRMYYISSAWYASEWWYKTAMIVAKAMGDGKPAGFFATDFQVCLKHNLKTVEQIEEEKRDNAVFDMQYGNIPGNVNADAYFPIEFFKRTIKKAFYPMRKEDYAKKKNIFAIPRVDGEIRIMGIDLATRSSTQNDNSCTSCIRLIPSKKGYQRSLVYVESSHGANSIVQANRIKDIWHWFNADYICMDIAQVGISVFDSMSSPYYNEEIGVQYPAFTVMERSEIDNKVKEELRERTSGVNALPIIFPISGNESLNTEIHVAFRTALQKKLWSFLINDVEAEDFLIRTQPDLFSANDSATRAFMLHPHLQTSLFISEATNLQMKLVNSNIKLLEGSGRKDRYSSVSYGNYLCSLLDKDLLKQEDNTDDFLEIANLVQSV